MGSTAEHATAQNFPLPSSLFLPRVTRKLERFRFRGFGGSLRPLSIADLKRQAAKRQEEAQLEAERIAREEPALYWNATSGT